MGKCFFKWAVSQETLQVVSMIQPNREPKSVPSKFKNLIFVSIPKDRYMHALPFSISEAYSYKRNVAGTVSCFPNIYSPPLLLTTFIPFKAAM